MNQLNQSINNSILNAKSHTDNADLKFVTGIGPTTDKILNNLFDKLSMDGVKENLIYKCIDPVTEIITDKIQPYIYVSMGLYIILIILLLVVIYLLIIKK